jgi:hypothetical protein
MDDKRNIIIPGIKFTGGDEREYETTGEYRPPKKGEAVVHAETGEVCYSAFDYMACRIILRELPPPAPPRRVPTDRDAIHRPQCWVRDHEQVEWIDKPQTLIAVLSETAFPFKAANSDGYVSSWRCCEIEDVPLRPVYHWRDATSEGVGTIP